MFYYKNTIILETQCYLQLAEKDLEAKEPLYERILQNGNSLLDDTEDGPEKEAVQQKLDDLTKKWDDVKDKTKKRTDDLDRLYPLAQAHSDSHVTFSVYLDGAEKKLNGFKQPAIDQEELDRQKKELEVRY
jgi:Spectrin repeat.